MRRALVTALLVAVIVMTATACGEEGLDGVGGSASEVAGRVEDAAAEVGDRLSQAGEQQAASGGDEQPEPDQPQEPEPEEAAAEEPAPEEPATDETSASLWPLALLALLALLLIALLVASRRRNRAAGDRQQRLLDDALLDVDWLIDTASEQPSQLDAAPRARDVRVRTDRMSDALRRLEEASRQRVADAAQEVRVASQDLAQAVIVRLDDVAAGRSPTAGLDADALAERVRSARDRLIQAV